MILYYYILRNHIAPFLYSTFTLIAIFLLQFLMKFSERLIGKGLESIVIVKLIAFNLAWMLVLVIPMSVLISTLMAFGAMSQNNEITIMKATGISLYKMLIAPLLAAFVIAVLLVQFNNYIYPNANHSARLLMQDVSNKKPTLSLVPGVFSKEIPNYAVLARGVSNESNELYNITVYDYSQRTQINIITAEKGELYFSKNQEYLFFELYNGEIHTNSITERDEYRKIVFEKHRIALPGEQFSFQQSSSGGPRGDREMGAQEMIEIVDSLTVNRNAIVNNLNQKINDYLKIDSTKYQIERNQNVMIDGRFFSKLYSKLNNAKNSINSSQRQLENNEKEINRYRVEIHKKYALPVACIVFILLGAPLGTMTRKGGFGIAGGISLFFFVVYWFFLIGGEKLADRGMFSPFWGIWSANFILGLLGIYLTILTAKEQITLDFSFIKKFIPKKFLKDDKDI